MKYVVLVGDGMGDYPVDTLDGRTPLQAAMLINVDVEVLIERLTGRRTCESCGQCGLDRP